MDAVHGVCLCWSRHVCAVLVVFVYPCERFLYNLIISFAVGAFMIGFTVFCPLFAHLSHYYRTGTLMATGLGMWVAAAVFAGTFMPARHADNESGIERPCALGYVIPRGVIAGGGREDEN